MNICWNRIRLALVALACVGLSGCDWVLLDSKGMVGLAQRDLILICIGLMLIVVIPAIVLTFVFGLMSRKIMRLAKKRDVDYSFLFARPDGDQLARMADFADGVGLNVVALEKLDHGAKHLGGFFLVVALDHFGTHGRAGARGQRQLHVEQGELVVGAKHLGVGGQVGKHLLGVRAAINGEKDFHGVGSRV